jgi:hypothetical protein
MAEEGRLVAMKETAEVGALMAAVEAASSPEAMRGLAIIIAQAAAGRTLSRDVAGMIDDLFGGSDPRKVAEAARGALALYSVTKQLGAGSDLLRRFHEDTGPAAEANPLCTAPVHSVDHPPVPPSPAR